MRECVPTGRRAFDRPRSAAGGFAVEDGVERFGDTGRLLVAALQGEVSLLQDLKQLAARPRDPALDRADGALADGGCLLIGQAAGADHDQHLALALSELPEGPAKIGELEVGVLRRRRGGPFAGNVVDRLYLEAVLANLVVEQVAQDGEDPRLEVRSRLELVRRGQ